MLFIKLLFRANFAQLCLKNTPSRCIVFTLLFLVAFVRPSFGQMINRTGWVASASVNDSDGQPANAIDGNVNTRWTTGTSQVNGQWFQVDMGSTQSFCEIVLNETNSPGDYPRGYHVNVSDDGSNWGSPVAVGSGTEGVTTIIFTNQTARYIRVTQTGSVSGIWWSIAEFNAYTTSAPAAPTGVTVVPGGTQVALSWAAAPLA